MTNAEIIARLNEFSCKLDDGDIIMECPNGCYNSPMDDVKGDKFIGALVAQALSHECVK